MKVAKKLNKQQQIIIGVVSALVLCFVLVFTLYKVNTAAVSEKKEEVLFEVVQGDNLSSVTKRLEEMGIIKSATFAKFGAKINGNSEFMAGLYKVDKSWNANEILEYFTSSDNIEKDEVMLTFREGIWAKEIAVILDKNLDVSAQDMLTLWNDEVFLRECIDKYEFLDESILNEVYRVKLEGYLFPETYSFNIHSTPEEITYRFLDQFNTEYESIKKDLKKTDFTFHELITFASVLEYETGDPKDMTHISGLFYNRLNQGMKMESSATVCYALYDFDDWTECEMYYGTPSPYNTYVNEGLPIGPILNPGKAAIEASLYPEKTEDLFFVADVHNVRGEGANKSYFSKTYEEHLKIQKELLGY